MKMAKSKKKSKQSISCVYPPIGKFLGGITKPKANFVFNPPNLIPPNLGGITKPEKYVTIKELTKMCKKEGATSKCAEVSDCGTYVRCMDCVSKRILQAALKVAKERKE
jgi:hypothetical protein